MEAESTKPLSEKPEVNKDPQDEESNAFGAYLASTPFHPKLHRLIRTSASSSMAPGRSMCCS